MQALRRAVVVAMHPCHKAFTDRVRLCIQVGVDTCREAFGKGDAHLGIVGVGARDAAPECLLPVNLLDFGELLKFGTPTRRIAKCQPNRTAEFINCRLLSSVYHP